MTEYALDEPYAALTWLLACQPHIEKKLADPHLSEGGLALYDSDKMASAPILAGEM